MPTIIDTVEVAVKANLSPLEQQLRAAEARIKSKQILAVLGLDVSRAERELEAFARRMSGRLNIKGKITFDTSTAEAQITQLEQRVARIGGSGGFAGSGTNFAGGLTSVVGGIALGTAAAGFVASGTGARFGSRVNSPQLALPGPVGRLALPSPAFSGLGSGNQTMQVLSPATVGALNVSGGGGFAGSRQIVGQVRASQIFKSGDASKIHRDLKPGNVLLGAGGLRGEVGGGFNGAGKDFYTASGQGGGGGGGRGFANFAFNRGFGNVGINASLKGLGITGAAVGLFVGQAARGYAQYGQNQATAISAQASIAAGRNYSASDQFAASLSPFANAVTSYVPGAGALGNALATGANAAILASAQAGNTRADAQQTSSFRNINLANQNAILGATTIGGSFDAARNASVATAQQDQATQIQNLVNSGAGNKAITASRNASNANIAAIRAASDRNRDAAIGTRDALSGNSLAISGATGVNNRLAGQLGIKGAFLSRINGTDKEDSVLAQQELGAANAAEARLYGQSVRSYTRGNLTAAYSASGFNLAASLSQNNDSRENELTGVTDTAQRNRINTRYNSNAIGLQADFDFGVSSNNRQAGINRIALGGNSLSASLAQIELNKDTALRSDNDGRHRDSILNLYNSQSSGARLSDAFNRISTRRDTRDLNRSTASQGLRNSGNYIAAAQADIFNTAQRQIEEANTQFRGSEYAQERRDRITAITANAGALNQSIASEYSRGLTLEAAGGQIFGNAKNRGISEDIANFGKATTAGFNQLNNSDQTLPGQTGAAWTANDVSKALQILQDIASNVGVQ